MEKQAILHTPTEVPKVKEYGFYIPIGKATQVAIRTSYITSNADLRSIPIRKRECYFDGEMKLEYFRLKTKQYALDPIDMLISVDYSEPIRELNANANVNRSLSKKNVVVWIIGCLAYDPTPRFAIQKSIHVLSTLQIMNPGVAINETAIATRVAQSIVTPAVWQRPICGFIRVY